MHEATSICVAVVDDDKSICRSLGRLLRAQGMRAITYSSAEEFLADTKHPPFGCLVLDVRLGGMSGLELARKLQETGSDAPFIFLTAHDSQAMRTRAVSSGCSAFFAKTNAGHDVIGTIRRLAGQANE